MGCATYQTKVDSARKLLTDGEPDQAVKLLAPLANKADDDQLIYLFDYATSLQAAGQYKESNNAFIEADRLTDLKDYSSISRIGGSLLFNEGMVQYKGEDFEKLLIYPMTAINFLMLGDRENALVQIRRLNEKLEYYRLEEKKSYEQNTFAIYLSALIWEADRDWDSAYISFAKAYKRDPNLPYIKEDLVRAARRAGRMEEFDRWKREFNIQPKAEWSDKNMGELVLIYQQGWGPRKSERPRIVAPGVIVVPGFPMLVPVSSNTQAARMDVVGGPSVQTEPVYSVEEVAIKTLEDEYAGLVAKRVAGMVAKEVVSDQVAQKNETLGMLLKLGMYISDQADLRQWSTLPQTFQIAKTYLRPGKYKVSVKGLFAKGGSESGEAMPPIEVQIKPGQKSFFTWRSFK